MVTYWRPYLGLGVFVLSLITTLQIPTIMEYPFFFGPEPIFYGFCAAVSLRALVSSQGDICIPPVLKISLITYVMAVLASAFLVWINIWDLPRQWPMILTLDALSKVFFWRWENPFHFLRITLLYMEGVTAFFLISWIVKRNPKRAVLFFTGSFVLCGILLMGYSAMELLLRGKELSIYPGFGPVFMDRNAYAAFWVLYLPFVIGLASRTSRWLRAGFACLALLSWFWCIASMSFTGILVSTGVGILSLLVSCIPKGGFSPFRFGRRSIAFVSIGLVSVMALGSFVAWEVFSREPSSFLVTQRIQVLLKEGTFSARVAFWVPAANMFGAYPLLGIGPGEVYRNLDRLHSAAIYNQLL